MDKGGNVNMEKKISSSILYDSEGNAIIRIQVTDNKFVATTADGNLLLTVGLDENGLAHGEETEYFDGRVSARLHFKHGNLDGRQEIYEGYSSDEEPMVAQYKNGAFVSGDEFFKNEMPMVGNVDVQNLIDMARELLI